METKVRLSQVIKPRWEEIIIRGFQFSLSIVDKLENLKSFIEKLHYHVFWFIVISFPFIPDSISKVLDKTVLEKHVIR